MDAVSANFDTCIARVLANEGGYKAASPDDPGGETNFGIAKRYHPDVDIPNLTAESAKAIYLAEYWTPIRGDELPLSVAYQLLDFAVNSGVTQAIRTLQGALGVPADGILGPVTLARINGLSSLAQARLAMIFASYRLRFLTSLPNWGTQGAGWVRRVAGNLVDAAGDVTA